MRLMTAGLMPAIALLAVGCGSPLDAATVSLSSRGSSALSVHSGQNFQVVLTAQPGCQHAGFRFRTGANPDWHTDPAINTINGNVVPITLTDAMFLPEGQLAVEVLQDDGQGNIGAPIAHPCDWSVTVSPQ